MQSDQSRRGFLRTLGAAALLSPARPAGEIYNVGYARAMLQAALSR